jgi:HAD superfamily hydrolase (TIGR01484 family)
MNVTVLATDYDGTLAEEGCVADSTIREIEKLKLSGRRIVLVTGRELDQLLGIFDRVDLFEWIVAENGALLYCPHTREKRLLSKPVPLHFVQELKRRGVSRISTGDTVVATWRPHEDIVEQVIRELGLDWKITFNKDAVMILPDGVDKASGLAASLHAMDLSWEHTVGIGDAENDIAFLTRCRYSAAVSNALDTVKAQVDLTTRAARGAGVVEFVEEILHDDLRSRLPRVRRERSAVPSDASS